jgi:hypothetical protein
MFEFLERNTEAIWVGVVVALVVMILVKIMTGNWKYWSAAVGLLRNDYKRLAYSADKEGEQRANAMNAIMAMQIRFGFGAIVCLVPGVAFFVAEGRMQLIAVFFCFLFFVHCMAFLSYNSLYFKKLIGHREGEETGPDGVGARDD